MANHSQICDLYQQNSNSFHITTREMICKIVHKTACRTAHKVTENENKTIVKFVLD